MKTWFVVGVVLIIAGLATIVGLGLGGTMLGLTTDVGAVGPGENVSPAYVAERISNSARWTAVGLSAFGAGTFLIITAGVVRSLTKRADKE